MSTRSTTISPTRKPRSKRGSDSYDHLEPMFAELAVLDTADPRRKPLREDLITRCLPLAANIAHKYVGRGESYEDLLQAARVGLVTSVDRFDPDFGSSFLSFAIPTIMGEVRRHFRDYTWAVRVPRQLKEIQLTIGPAIDRLFQREGRMPTAADLARELDVDLAEITQALIARNGYRSSSIDACLDSDGDFTPLSRLDSLGAEESEFCAVDDRLAVQPLIAALPERDRRVLRMRFFDSQPQVEIAESLGLSQMQISRMLSRMLNSLHDQALRD